MAAENERIELPGGLTLSAAELSFVHSRSAGPGGQNVNKVNTRVTLLFDVPACQALSPDQKRRIMDRLSGRVNRQGVLRVVSSRFRTQQANRRATVQRLARLLSEALTPPVPRKPTRTPARAHARRLTQKTRQSHRKQLRRPPAPDD